MCDHTNDPGGREAAMVEASLGVWCDPCIAPIVKALNAAGVRTVASCCGHGKRPGKVALADGRELFILPDFASAREFDRANSEADQGEDEDAALAEADMAAGFEALQTEDDPGGQGQ